MRGLAKYSDVHARATRRCSTRFTNKVRLQRDTHVNEVSQQVAVLPRRNVLRFMAAGSVVQASQTLDAKASPSLPAWRQGSEWMWNGMKVRWSVLGEDKPGTPLLLVHGFGASLEHWRYNAPVLAENRPVYSIDLLGFGFSDKPTTPNGFKCWGGHVWARQLLAFIDEVVKEPVVLVGNSLGGYSSLMASVAGETSKESVKGLVLVNSAGPLVEGDKQDDPFWSLADDLDALDKIDSDAGFSPGEFLKKFTAYVGFIVLRSKTRVLQILSQVYTDSKENINDDLSDLILGPAWTANSFEVFYQTTVGGNGKPGISVNKLMETLRTNGTPTALLWGVNDPWITDSKAQQMLGLNPEADYIPLVAGHCPHDEKPADFNAGLNEWLTAKGL